MGAKRIQVARDPVPETASRLELSRNGDEDEFHVDGEPSDEPVPPELERVGETVGESFYVEAEPDRRRLLGGQGLAALGRYPCPVEIGNLEKVLRVGEGRRLKRLQEQAAYITSLEPEFEKLSAADLQGKTAEFRQRLENGESLDDLTFEAFAAVREARKRASDQRMFDVQLMGGIVLHEGDIAEMKTGEGKTFVASLALYLNGLAGRGTHLITTNDYLAQRDAEWNRPVFESLGMTRRLHRDDDAVRRSARRRTTPTSRTGRTPSSASTTCATTWRSASTASSSAATLTESSTRSTRS